MFRSRLLLASLLFTSIFTACGTEDDDIWMPPSATGKADGVQILKGSDIPSQYVDSSKHYLTGRRIDSLEQVTALKDMADMVAKRADGIIANLPANGRLEAAELVRMENAQIFATLFPEEKQELPKLWDMLLAPTPNPTSVGVPAVDLTITEQLDQPSGLTVPTSILISSLDAALQPVAKRVQLVFNGDNNAGTIQIADIDKVLADPQAFTQAEVTQLNTIKGLFLARATSVEEAKAKMPSPGHSEKTTALGQMSLELTSDVVLHDHRQIYGGGTNNWSATLTIEQTDNVTLHAPANDKIMVLQLDNGTETIYNGADIVYGQHPVGDVVIERYTAGARQETHDVALPPFQAGAKQTDASSVLDYKLVTGNNATLYKNAYAETSNGYWTYLDSRYEKTMNQAPNIAQTEIDRFATAKSSLPTGRYEIQTPSGTLALDLYPEAVVIAHMNAATVRLQPANQQATGTVGGNGIVFYPLTNQVTVNNSTSVVTTAQRTK